MNNVFTPKATRQLVILSVAMLLVSVVISGVNAYVTLAAPAKSPYVSDKVGFEGQLADSSGNPVSDGNYTVMFSLYSQASGGTAVWSETQTVAVTDGLYSVQLGSNTALPSNAFDGSRWLGVKVGSDSEMTPRISISAVPFALNAKQAMGLQGFNVSSSSPSNNNGLFWDSTNSVWAPRNATFPDLGAVGNNANPQSFFANYRSGAILTWSDANNVSVSAGQVMVNGYMRSNSSAVNVGFTSGGLNLALDTGSATSNTKYYIYAIADDTSVSTFQLIISASSSAPTGKTHYRKLGWFSTNQSSTNIEAGSVGNVIEVDPNSAPGARVYNNADQSASNGADTVLAFNSERFDSGQIHDISTNNSRLTVQTPGKYLIFGSVYGTPNTGANTWLKIKYTPNGGSATFIAQNLVVEGSAQTYLSIATVYYLNQNDYVELVFKYNNVSGASDLVIYAPNYSPEFGIVRIGD